MIQNRWGDVTLRSGFVVVPVSLLRNQAKLEIENSELVVLLHALAHWHDDGKPVWAAYSSFATDMGVSPRTVQRMVSSLEGKGLIELKRNPEGRVISFNGLIQKLKKLESERN